MFNSPLLRTLGIAFTQSDASHEHSALHSKDLSGQILLYGIMGFKLKQSTATSAFLQRGKHRIELIDPAIPEHEAWAMPTVEAYERVCGFFDTQFAHLFEPLEYTVTSPDLKARLFQYRRTGEVIQLLWRRNPIFDDVFPDVEAAS